MLSYQHIFHAGNLADVHKHSLLAWVIDYMTHKDKPFTYLESHAGRGVYALDSDASVKTGEAAAGIAVAEGWFAADHPYMRSLAKVRARFGETAYPGSPQVAVNLMRKGDRMRLAELHPQEHAALVETMRGTSAVVEKRDGLEMIVAATPPEPRRGVLLVDPSFEVKSDYDRLPHLFARIARQWNVGVLMLWYPILDDAPHAPMIAGLDREFPNALRHEVRFPPAREGHRMVGSGLYVVNPPWGMAEEAARITAVFKAATKG